MFACCRVTKFQIGIFLAILIDQERWVFPAEVSSALADTYWGPSFWKWFIHEKVCVIK